MGKAFVAKLAKEGARDPEALAAWIGRRKHGPQAFQKLAKTARKKSDGSGPKSGPKDAMDLSGPAPKLTESDLTPEEQRRLRPRPGFTAETLDDIAASRLSRARIKHLQASPPSTHPANTWEEAMVKASAKSLQLGGIEMVHRTLERAKVPKNRLEVLHGQSAEVALQKLDAKARRSAARRSGKK